MGFGKALFLDCVKAVNGNLDEPGSCQVLPSCKIGVMGLVVGQNLKVYKVEIMLNFGDSLSCPWLRYHFDNFQNFW